MPSFGKITKIEVTTPLGKYNVYPGGETPECPAGGQVLVMVSVHNSGDTAGPIYIGACKDHADCAIYGGWELVMVCQTGRGGFSFTMPTRDILQTVFTTHVLGVEKPWDDSKDFTTMKSAAPPPTVPISWLAVLAPLLVGLVMYVSRG